MAASNAHWSAQRQGTRSNGIFGVIAFVLGVVIAFVAFWTGVALASIGVLLIAMVWIRSWLWRRAFREAKKYQGDITLVFGDDKIHVENAVGTSDLEWSFYSWYMDTPAYLLLYMSKRTFAVIPKAVFEGDTAAKAFVDMVASKLARIR